MSELLNNLFEKYKAKGDDEQRFMDKHTDNIQVTSAAGADESKAKNKKYDRKKHRKGYEPGEDEDVYESLIDIDGLSEAIDEFCEESSEEDIDILEEILNNEEYMDELLQYILDEEDNEEDNEEDEDEDLDEASSGKYPHHIKTVSSGAEKGVAYVTTNNGSKYKISAKDTKGQMPKPGQHISDYVKEEEDLDEAEFPTWEVKVRKPFGRVKAGQHVNVKARDVAEAIKKATYRWTNDKKVVWPSSHFEVKKRG
jgi:hypothetical protein